MEHDKLALTLPWEAIDLSAQQQIIKTLHMPELIRLAVMPDVHAGYDLCIGGVALLRDAVSPSFVGYDIGCGMCHVNTGKSPGELNLDSAKAKEALFADLQRRIPAGVGKGHKLDTDIDFDSAGGDKNLNAKVRQNIPRQLATLGSGNHFLEIGVNAQNEVGVTIHSGSRRCGYDIASHYMKKRRLMPLASDLGRAYLEDMDWGLAFALENRRLMLEQALAALGFSAQAARKFFASPAFINETHNHALVTAKGVLHRKGATAAEQRQMGVIPANQRDGVYITKGLGNKAFLSSASHGAGRALARKQAAAAGDVAQLKKAMTGIVCRTDAAILDEAPWAYKDIGPVLAAQNGILVDVLDHFKPLVVLKG